MPASPEAGPDPEPVYDLPFFSDQRTGFEQVIYPTGNFKATLILFATHDSGRTWRPDRILSNLSDISGSSILLSTVADDIWIFASAPPSGQPPLLKVLPGSGATDGAELHLDRYACSLSFATADVGWEDCQGTLLSTLDGGATWTDITPHFRDGMLTTDPITPPIPLQMRVIPMPPRGSPAQPASKVHPSVQPVNPQR